jgi:hypothetical protein
MRTGEYPDDWDDRRKQVLERDGHECQECGATDTTLQVHHITPISEGGSHSLGNLKTICRSCHAGEHPQKVTLNTALRENRRIRMKYRSGSGTRVREVDPYALEMHEGIQYLVGHDYFRNEIRHFRPTRIQWVEETDRRFEPPSDFDATSYLSQNLQSREGQTECFIATAAYGTANESEIDQLRAFRDDILLQHIIGRLFVSVYYRCSPPVAEWISRKEWRRRAVRNVIIAPSLRFVSLWKLIARKC